MADDKDTGDSKEADSPSLQDHLNTMRGHYKELNDHLEAAGKIYDKANDTMDNIESKLSGIKGQRLPQRRPIAAGPDAAGNNRSSNAPIKRSNNWYDDNAE